FVTHNKHRHTNREHCYGQKVLHLPISELPHAGIIGGTFDTTIPASIIVCSITVIFAVCFIVLVVIRDEVVQREAVMTSHKIDTLLRLAFFMPVNCRATKQTVSKPCYGSSFATKKAPHVVSKTSIPFLPTVSNKTAYLIKPSRVPGFCDEFGSR